MKLYSYFRSSAAFRVRIALHLKGLAFDTVPVHMLRNGGEQHALVYRRVSPLGIVPALQDGDLTLTQSLAICEYLEERYPEPPLLPGTLEARAHVRAVAAAIACEIHPLNNLRALHYLVRNLGASEEEKLAWYRHWIAQGLSGVEAMIADSAGNCCLGDTLSLADVFLVPQVANALRFACPMDAVPTVMRIYEHCMKLPAFVAAQPSRQPDAE